MNGVSQKQIDYAISRRAVALEGIDRNIAQTAASITNNGDKSDLNARVLHAAYTLIRQRLSDCSDAQTILDALSHSHRVTLVGCAVSIGLWPTMSEPERRLFQPEHNAVEREMRLGYPSGAALRALFGPDGQ